MNQALLLAAGFSTRLRPLTKDIPKILVPFLHVRMIDMQLAFLKHSGLNSLAINAHHGAKTLVDELQKIQEFRFQTFVETPNILGTGGAIFNMKSFVRDEHVFIMNSDVLCGLDVKKAFEFHQKQNAKITMILTNADPLKYGQVGIDENNRITRIRSYQGTKPIKSMAVFSGLQIFHRSVFDMPHPEGEFDLIEHITLPLIQAGEKVLGYIDPSFWLDIGELKSFLPSQFEFLKANPEWAQGLLKDFFKPKEDLWIHPTANISKSAIVSGPAFIGPHCQVEDFSKIDESILSSIVFIHSQSSLKNSFLYPKQMIQKQRQLTNMIVHSDRETAF